MKSQAGGKFTQICPNFKIFFFNSCCIYISSDSTLNHDDCMTCNVNYLYWEKQETQYRVITNEARAE